MTRYTLRSMASPADCRRRLIGALSTPAQDLPRQADAMLGAVGDTRFHFWEHRGWWAPFIPRCYGKIAPLETGTIIRGSVHVSLFEFLALLFATAVILSFVALSQLGGRLERWFLLFVILAALPLLTLQLALSRWRSTRYIGFLEKTLDGPGQG